MRFLKEYGGKDLLFENLKKFFSDAWIELRRKVTWPDRKEVYGTTVVVLIAVFIFAIYLYSIDMVLSRVIKLLFGL